MLNFDEEKPLAGHKQFSVATNISDVIESKTKIGGIIVNLNALFFYVMSEVGLTWC